MPGWVKDGGWHTLPQQPHPTVQSVVLCSGRMQTTPPNPAAEQFPPQRLRKTRAFPQISARKMCGLAVSVGADVFKERIQLGGVFYEGEGERSSDKYLLFNAFSSTSSIVAPLLLPSTREVSSENLSVGSEVSAIQRHHGVRL